MASTTIEREPDFEDEKIRIWQIAKDEGATSPAADDETVMPVDMEREELYESRIYPLLPHPATVLFIANQVAKANDPPRVLEALMTMGDTLSETMLKILSKRNRENGQISYMMVAVSPDLRALIEQGEVADDAEYRRVVEGLEQELLVPGLVGEPLITGPEEWKKYEQGLPGDETAPLGP